MMTTRRTPKPAHIISASALMMLLVSAPAHAAGNAANGLKIARQWCSSCHSVELQGSATDKAPPFADIAQRRNGKWIKAWLADPHPPMTGIDLSNAQINDLVAYIQSLAKP